MLLFCFVSPIFLLFPFPLSHSSFFFQAMFFFSFDSLLLSLLLSLQFLSFFYQSSLSFLASCSIFSLIILFHLYFTFWGRAKRAPHWGVQSRFRVIYIYIYMLSVCCMSVVCQINCVGGITWPTRMLKVF